MLTSPLPRGQNVVVHGGRCYSFGHAVWEEQRVAGGSEFSTMEVAAIAKQKSAGLVSTFKYAVA
jgi:hypothetical protein